MSAKQMFSKSDAPFTKNNQFQTDELIAHVSVQPTNKLKSDGYQDFSTFSIIFLNIKTTIKHISRAES